jgi:hypothetical protein
LRHVLNWSGVTAPSVVDVGRAVVVEFDALLLPPHPAVRATTNATAMQ